ncbi:hypothetical protein HY968_04575 [Candidatus Kaiserbacteria bacterium]|nr:hypothetical protein [Candidatus Kaiserbacteria bacterium]
MMWMMIICCALPLAFLLFGGAGLFSGGYLWPILVGVLALACIGMMVRGHGKHREDRENHGENALDAEDAASPSHKKKDHSCCH